MEETAPYKKLHPYLLDSIDQLPENLRDPTRHIGIGAQDIEKIFVIPSAAYPKGWKWVTKPQQALLFNKKGVFHISGATQPGFTAKYTYISANDILVTRITLILLYSKLEISGLEQGMEIEVEYNTSSHHLLIPYINRLIRDTWGNDRKIRTEKPKGISCDDIARFSYKFFYGLTYEALQAGEKVLGYVFQQEIIEKKYKFYRKVIFPKSVIVFTDKQIILLQEDLRNSSHHESIYTFIPLHRIDDLVGRPVENYDHVTIALSSDKTNYQPELILTPQNSEKLFSIWESIKAYRLNNQFRDSRN